MSQICRKVKAAIFHPVARERIRSFPVEVRKESGKAIYDLQRREALYALFTGDCFDRARGGGAEDS